MQLPLKHHLQRKLQNSGVARDSDLSELPVRLGMVRIVEVDVIKNVERLGAKLHITLACSVILVSLTRARLGANVRGPRKMFFPVLPKVPGALG